jgi:SSS family solute:Na+ symporter
MTTSEQPDDPKGIPLTAGLFKTGPVFNISAYAIMIILVVLYAVFW